MSRVLAILSNKPLAEINGRLENIYDRLFVAADNGLISVRLKKESLIQLNKTLIANFKKNLLINTNLEVNLSGFAKKYPEIDLSKFKFQLNSDDSQQSQFDSRILDVAIDVHYEINADQQLVRRIVIPMIGFKEAAYQSNLDLMNQFVDRFEIQLKTYDTNLLQLKADYDHLRNQKYESRALRMEKLLSFIQKHFLLPENIQVKTEEYEINLIDIKLNYLNGSHIKAVASFAGLIYLANKKVTTPIIKISDFKNYQFIYYRQKKYFLQNESTIFNESAYQKYFQKTTKVFLANLYNPLNWDFVNQKIRSQWLSIQTPDWSYNQAIMPERDKNFKILNMYVNQIETPNALNRSITADLVVEYSFMGSNYTYNFNETFGVRKHGYVFDKNLQDFIGNAHLATPNLKRSDLSRMPQNLGDVAGSKILSGGYLEVRKFYLNNDYMSLHAGEDTLVEANTPVYAPFDGQIDAVFHVTSPAEADGVGGILVMTVKREDLINKIDPYILEHELKDVTKVRIGFMHMSLNTVKHFDNDPLETNDPNKTYTYAKNITPQNPKAVKAGDLIGYVGTTADNGGWPPHVHITVTDVSLSGGSQYYDYHNWLIKRATDPRATDVRLMKYYDEKTQKYDYKNALTPGVFGRFLTGNQYMLSNVTSAAEPIKNSYFLLNNKKIFLGRYLVPYFPSDQYKTKQSFADDQALLDPNLFFNFRNANTPMFVINNFVKDGSDTNYTPVFNIQDQIKSFEETANPSK